MNSGEMYVFRSRFYDNLAESGEGGGIFNSASGTATLFMSEVSGNMAYINGGGVYNEGEMLIRRSKISGNDADENGGGIYLASGALKLVSSKVVENHAGTGFAGGGVYTAGGALEVIRSVITANTPDDCAPVPCP